MKKRLFDIAFSSVALVVAAVPMAVLYVAIRKENGKAGIFKQERVGKDKEPFTIYKFRSLKEEFDKEGNKRDLSERVTPLLDFIRRRGLDELPQLFNVLKGDMSIVGPRPLPVYDNEVKDRNFDIYSVRPGLISPYTIHTLDSGVADQDKQNDMDSKYAKESVSLKKDIGILARAFMPIACGRNVQDYDDISLYKKSSEQNTLDQ